MFKKAKLLIITNTCAVGGAETHLLHLLSNLDRNKYDITLAYFTEKFHNSRSLKNDFKKAGIRTIDLDLKMKYCPIGILKVANLIRCEKPDIVHTNLFQAEFLTNIALLLLKKFGKGLTLRRGEAQEKVRPFSTFKAFVTTWHNMEEFLENRFLAKIAKFDLNRTDQVIVISEAVADYLSAKTGFARARIKKIHYGFNLTKDRPWRQGPPLAKEGDLVLGMVARYAPQKGHIYFIEAMPEILKEVPNVKFYFAGSDEKGIKNRLKDRARELGIEKNIIFADFDPDPVGLMSQFDIFVLPSLWEGFGLVLLEAMSVGRPIVATNVGPIPEIIQDGQNGFLVPPKDPKILAEKIIILLKDKSLREKMGNAGKERLKEFSIEKMVKETEGVYDKLLLEH